MTGILGYNVKNDRFGLLVMDLWKIDGFHCGDTFEVWIYDTEEWKEDRLEFDWVRNEWYLVNLGLSGDYLCGLKIRV
ncbi:MAG: DUF5348 domain-containing protein [Clostridia bacterium]|nr:DUF5348 domain-containing protein [Clostridia bacterium]